MTTDARAAAAYIVAAKRDCTVCDGDGYKMSDGRERDCGGCGATGSVYSYPPNVRCVAEAYLALSEWQPIETAPHGVEIIGEDERGVIERTWYFAPSKTTRDWLKFSNNKPWHPVRWMPAQPSLARSKQSISNEGGNGPG